MNRFTHNPGRAALVEALKDAIDKGSGRKSRRAAAKIMEKSKWWQEATKNKKTTRRDEEDPKR